jgi:hypothetical protein
MVTPESNLIESIESALTGQEFKEAIKEIKIVQIVIAAKITFFISLTY